MVTTQQPDDSEPFPGVQSNPLTHYWFSLAIISHPLPKYWNYRCVLPHPTSDHLNSFFSQSPCCGDHCFPAIPSPLAVIGQLHYLTILHHSCFMSAYCTFLKRAFEIFKKKIMIPFWTNSFVDPRKHNHHLISWSWSWSGTVKMAQYLSYMVAYICLLIQVPGII